jgi:hypothetical protein
LLVFCLLLSACAETRTLYKPVAVEVPVAVPCEAPKIERPAFPVASLSPQSPLFDQVKALVAENELRQGYEAELEAAVGGCR